MNAIDSALRFVNANIPTAILEAAFIDKDQRLFNTATSIDNEIIQKVIRPFVLPDLNKFGPTVDINLTDLPHDNIDEFTRVFEIPPERTEGRNISDVLYAAVAIYPGRYGVPPIRHFHHTSRSAVINASSRVVASHSPMPRVISADVALVGPNMVSVRDPSQFRSDLLIRCVCEYSENLQEIRPGYYIHTDRLIWYAVRRYIYNKLALELDVARLDYGRDFSRFKDFVEEMSDSGQLYTEQLPVVARAMIHNDPIENRENVRNGGRFMT